MWAHYGDCHRGVCLIFAPGDDFFASAQPVFYREERPHLNPLVHSHHEMLDAAMFTKSDHWKYEHEWRILQYKRGAGVYSVPQSALKQVVLGADIGNSDKEKIIQWVAESPTKIGVTSASLSPKKFKVHVPNAWSSNLDQRSKGSE
jgi:hypothetical protein